MNKFLLIKNNQGVEYLIDSTSVENLIIHPIKKMIQVFLKSGKPMTIPGYTDLKVGDISELMNKEKELKKKRKEPKEPKVSDSFSTDSTDSTEFGQSV